MVKARLSWGLATFVALAQVAFACSSDPDVGPTPTCPTPTRACTGADGCAGTQSCNADGQTYSACVCAPVDSGVPDAPVDTGTDTGVDAGTWEPRDMPGLTLWLDGSKGVVEDAVKPGKVFKWQDRSGKSNDATVASTDPPAIQANAVNGKGAVNCDAGTYLSIKDGDTLKFGTGDYGIITVAKTVVANNVGPTLFEKGVVAQITGEGSFRLITLAPGGGEAVVNNAPVNAFALYIARGKKMEVRAGGKTGSGPTTNIDVNDTNPAYICRGTVDAPAVIAEMMVVKGTLSDADIAQAQKYVKNKYGF